MKRLGRGVRAENCSVQGFGQAVQKHWFITQRLSGFNGGLVGNKMSYYTRWLVICGIIGILSALPVIGTMNLIPWAEPTAESKPVVYYSPSLPLRYHAWPLNTLNLTMSNFTDPLGVGSLSLITVAIKSPYDVDNATVRLDLLQALSDQPIGLSFVDENLTTWNVNLGANVPVSLQAKIETTEIGSARILATATWYDDLEGYIKVSDALWVSVLENDTQVSRGADFYYAPQDLEIESYVPQFFRFQNNMTLSEATADFIVYPYKPHVGILSDGWMELITSLAVCAWVSLIASRATLCFYSEKVVVERKRLGVLMAATVMGGVALVLASGLYQVKPVIMDAEEIYYGFPFVWLKAFRGTWMTVTPWNYNVQWFGLVGDLALYSWVVFITYSMIFFLHRKIAHLHLEVKE